MKITVTQDDIEMGEACDPFYCPIARAANRAFPGAQARVGLEFLDIYSNQGRVRYPLPGIAKEFIDRHDSNEGSLPIEFEVNRPKNAKEIFEAPKEK